MQRETRPEGLDLQSAQLQRKESYRERTPSVSGSAVWPPSQLTPEPAYIAQTAATQIVNSEYVSRGPSWIDSESMDASGGLTVSPAALVLVNTFLDQMLFSFLKGTRSTSIVALKPAITDVLKPRLAKDAIEGADEELRGYMTGGDDEELSDFHNNQEFKGERNLHRIFRTTRLRCMVYTRLGDMEEEDEDEYLRNDSAQDIGEERRRRLSRDLGNVSPAAAIFLTSIIEFIAEQTLMIAGEAAFNRLGTRKSGSEDVAPVVEEGDVEKLAFNTTLGRLWRSWRSRSRPTSILSPRSSMRELQGRKPSISASDLASRTASVSEGDESGHIDRSSKQGLSVAEVLHEDRDPASIPLPAPRGLPEEPDFSAFGDGREADGYKRRRARSMIEYQGNYESSVDSETEELEPEEGEEHSFRPRHQRSASLPVRITPYVSPISDIFATPPEGSDPFTGRSEARANANKEVLELTDDSQLVQGPDNGNNAVSTMYDGLIKAKRDPRDPSTSSTRESSMVSEYSSRQEKTETCDEDMTPQALNFRKAAVGNDRGLAGDRESRASTVSSDYSFRAGDPAAPTGIFSPKKNKTDDAKTEEELPVRDDSLELPRGEVEKEVDAKSASKHVANLTTAQGDRLRTYDESGKAVKRDIPVLYEDPSNQDVIYNPSAPTRNLHEEVSGPSVIQVHSQGVPPPLTPLRELRDAAPDTSDEASSVAPSYEASRADDFTPPLPPTRGSEGHRSETYKSVTSSPTPPPVAGTKPVDSWKPPPAPNTVIERATVQRVSPSPGTGRDTASPYGRTSTSSNRDGRSSASSKINRIVGRESGDNVRQPIPTRISSETSEKLPIRYSKTPRSGDKELDFENLIKSDETIQYTLTPQNMRDMEDPDSPRWSDEARPSITSQAELYNSNSRTSGEKSTSPSTKQLKGMNGLRSNPTNGPSVAEFASPSKSFPTSGRVQQSGVVPKSPGGRTGSMPRDATMKDGSMRDLADFIRSTGPEADPKTVYKNKSMADKHSRNVSASSQQTSQQVALSGKGLPAKLGKHSPVVVPRSSEGSVPTRSASKLKARDPTVSSSNTTADLADFLRSGPPGGLPDSGAQLQRGQQLTNGVSNGRAIGSGTSLASTQDSFAPSKMTQSSANSRTGLLESSNRSGTKSNAQRSNRNEGTGGPVRKQRRIRDPFAIESDDEDEMGAEAPPEEESLSDFLRNYTPPPDSTNSRDIPMSISNSPASVDQKQRKTSGTTMRERLTRNIAVIPDYRPLPPKGTKKSSSSRSPPYSSPSDKRQAPTQRSTSAQHQSQQSFSNSNNTNGSPGTVPQLPPLNARASSPQPYSQNGNYKPEPYNATRTNYPVGRTGKPKPQARDETGARAGGSGISDLAEFLRNSEPPAPSAPAMMSFEPREKEGGFGKVFGRKRRV